MEGNVFLFGHLEICCQILRHYQCPIPSAFCHKHTYIIYVYTYICEWTWPLKILIFKNIKMGVLYWLWIGGAKEEVPKVILKYQHMYFFPPCRLGPTTCGQNRELRERKWEAECIRLNFPLSMEGHREEVYMRTVGFWILICWEYQILFLSSL